jgi:hypothetical protein
MQYKQVFWGANLIAQQSITNIFYQIVELLCILGIVEELCEILLGCERVQGLANLFQFPSDPCVSE